MLFYVKKLRFQEFNYTFVESIIFIIPSNTYLTILHLNLWHLNFLLYLIFGIEQLQLKKALEKNFCVQAELL